MSNILYMLSQKINGDVCKANYIISSKKKSKDFACENIHNIKYYLSFIFILYDKRVHLALFSPFFKKGIFYDERVHLALFFIFF